MSDQQPLFSEDIYSALRVCVAALGGNKKVGSDLFPEKPVEKAAEHLSSCLSPDRREKLDLDQFMWILRKARSVNCHAALYFMCDDANYERPRPVEPEEELADLQRQLTATANNLSELMARFEKATETLADMRRKPRAVC